MGTTPIMMATGLAINGRGNTKCLVDRPNAIPAILCIWAKQRSSAAVLPKNAAEIRGRFDQ
jgi:hypothetical protein